MDKGIAITQRSTFDWIEVEFAEGEEPVIPEDKADNSITERLVTALLSCPVTESPP